MKTHRWSRVTTPFLILALDGGEWSTSHSGHFTPWKELRYQFNRRLGGHQNMSEHFGKEKNILSLPGLDLLTVQNLV